MISTPVQVPSFIFAFFSICDRNSLFSILFNFDKHHHYLGLNAGPNLEIPALLKMGALDTTDSSGAFWFGLNGHKYSKTLDSYTVVKELVRPVDFNEPWHKSPAIHEAIQNNIDLTKELFDINNK